MISSTKHSIAAALLLTAATASAHNHYYVGISDTNGNGKADPDEPLAFVGANGTDRVFHLMPRPAGLRPAQLCGGYYSIDEKPRTLNGLEGFSIVSLDNGEFALEDPFHAMTGVYICCEITKVEGPPGAHFGFWDEDHSYYFDEPSVSMTTNEPTGNPRFMISEGSDTADNDPGGHIHDRSWTADKPGDYRVSFRFVDISTNRAGGGPWQAPSVEYTYSFRAGPDFQPAIRRTEAGVQLTWPGQMGIYEATKQTGIVFTVLRSASPAGPDWTPIGSVTGTTADTISFTDSETPVGKAFYKLAYDWADQ